MARREEISRREFLERFSPLGRLTLDASGCTGCGLCAAACPTGALEMTNEAGPAGFRLLFKHGQCPGCGGCIAACPETCLHLERTVDVAQFDDIRVLLEGGIIRCRKCDGPVGPATMVAKVRASLGPSLVEHLDLCPTCRTQSLSGRGGV